MREEPDISAIPASARHDPLAGRYYGETVKIRGGGVANKIGRYLSLQTQNNENKKKVLNYNPLLKIPLPSGTKLMFLEYELRCLSCNGLVWSFSQSLKVSWGTLIAQASSDFPTNFQ